MSNSIKHTPISGWCMARSERRDKQLWHRAFRHANKHYCLTEEYIQRLAPCIRDKSNPWSMNKDGKGWQGQGGGSFYVHQYYEYFPEEIVPLRGLYGAYKGYKCIRSGSVRFKQVKKEMRK